MIWIFITHIGALLVLLLNSLPEMINLVLGCLVLYSLYINGIKLLSRKNPAYIRNIRLDHADEWWLTSCDNRVFAAELNAAYVHPLITILNFQSQNKKFNVIITADIADSDNFRRLRVRLRHPYQRI